jgi:hypothetical protein
LLPSVNLALDSLPFFGLDALEHVGLYNDFFVHLIDFGVNHLVGDGFDGPVFNVLFFDLQEV